MTGLRRIARRRRAGALPTGALGEPGVRGADYAVVDARSALFDVFGDHLRARGEGVPVAALVRLLAPLGIAAPAVRTAVSRMAHQGWLTAVRVDGAPGYALTAQAVRRLDEAAARIYRTAESSWDGTWHLLVVTPPVARAARDRLHAGLQFLGYGSLGASGRAATWISPHESGEVDSLLVAEGARAERFTARHDGDSQALLARAWDLEALARAYRRFLDAGELSPAEEPASGDVGAYARRSQLVHEWRKFLFLDPGLPRALLPVDWPGRKAAEWFDAEAARLLPGATRYVRSCLEQDRGVYDDG